jgi:putative CRISPR-associated protein (TIGR02619 family)
VPVDALPEVSAECAIVHALHAERRLGPRPVVAVVHSDTFAGEAACWLVKHVLESTLEATVKPCRTADLDAENKVAFARSLGQLMTNVRNELGAGEPQTTCFSPIGGYKVMTALGYVAGSVGGYPMAYLHERTKVLHLVPPIPVRFDETVAREHAALFRALSRAPREMHELGSAEQDVVESHPFLFERADSLVMLGAFGVFVLEQLDPGALRTAVCVSDPVRALLRDGGQRAFLAKELRLLAEKLLDPERHRGVLHHEQAFDMHGAEVALYKGASGKAGVCRALYRYSESDDTLRVFHVWTNHDAYEREAAARARARWADTDAVHDESNTVYSA